MNSPFVSLPWRLAGFGRASRPPGSLAAQRPVESTLLMVRVDGPSTKKSGYSRKNT
jgi:hypothetical protein